MKYQNIRKEIKRISEEQVNLKPQRKTTNFKGNRSVSTLTAANTVQENKYILMHLYIAYRIIKGKEPIFPTKKEYSESVIKKLVEKFGVKEVA